MRLLRSHSFQSMTQFQSTHPSWGATYAFKLMLKKLDISIHAPIVGCDVYALLIRLVCSYFNPRTHRGVRRDAKNARIARNLFQSTHPSWGATYLAVNSLPFLKYFNPRTHRGVRPPLSCKNPYRGFHFNPRTHRGVRRESYGIKIFQIYFNPRTHRGVRPGQELFFAFSGKISIHAPIVGCDECLADGIVNGTDFNPRTHRGVRRVITVPTFGNSISIHAPIVGCDRKEWQEALTAYYFNPRTHRGVRLWYLCKWNTICYFNPRTHRGVRLSKRSFIRS